MTLSRYEINFYTLTSETENRMTILEKHIVIALTVSTLLILFNIIAVTTGSADAYYSQVEQFFSSYN